MTNTALRAENSNSRTITFKSKEHEKFYMEYLEKCRYQDVYHQALVYCLGIDRDTRNNVDKIYNFKTGCVKTECLQEGWQTSGSLRIVHMAFNLYCNGIPSVGDYEAEEANYNMIDGLMNNTPKKKDKNVPRRSVLKRLRNHQKKIASQGKGQPQQQKAMEEEMERKKK